MLKNNIKGGVPDLVLQAHLQIEYKKPWWLKIYFVVVSVYT